MVEVLKAGLFDTIQDLGRFCVQDLGIPYSGVMDLHSSKVVNAILRNSMYDAVMEITIVGPKLKFHCDTEIALSGADLSPMLNSETIKMNTRIQISNGDSLSFGRRSYGCRTYLGVKGGFQTEFIMNSYSFYTPITKQSKLKKGDQLPISEVYIVNDKICASLKINKTHFKTSEIEVFKGIEFNKLSSLEQKTLFSTEFTISKDSNRMAYQVDELLDNKIESIITSLVLPGTVQLTPSGILIILMRDCQTTGGYPRILQVSEQSIDVLSQKLFGEKFRFKCIE